MREIRRDTAIMTGMLVAFCVVTIECGERIGVNQGQGWDGMAYTAWAQDFPKHVLTEGVTRYYSQRILPSAVVGVGVRASGQTLDVRHVIKGFQILDALALVGGALLWLRIAAALQWNRRTTWVGFAALFLSFACARHALYYPTLTDSTAFALGMLLTWGYVANHASVLWITAAIGLWTWPAIFPHSVIMLLLPRMRDPAPPVPATFDARKQRILATTLGALAALGYTALALHYYWSPLPAAGFDKFVRWIRADLLMLTVPLTAVLIGLGTYCLFAARSVWNFGYVRGRRWRHRALVFGGIAGLLVSRSWWMHRVGTRGDGPTLSEFVCQQALEALRGPLWGLVHHVVYYGPIVIIAWLSWRKIATTAAAWGPAATFTMVATLAFVPGSESRQWIHLFPFLVTITMTATQERWTRNAALVFYVCALGWSKLWLRIGYDTPGDWLVFPTQKYFMHLGPWASDAMYAVHLTAVVVTVVLFYLTVFKDSRTANG